MKAKDIQKYTNQLLEILSENGAISEKRGLSLKEIQEASNLNKELVIDITNLMLDKENQLISYVYTLSSGGEIYFQPNKRYPKITKLHYGTSSIYLTAKGINQLNNQSFSDAPSKVTVSLKNKFSQLKTLIISSSEIGIDSKIVRIALYDLDQAQRAYENQSWKGCIVLLGAVLEGMLLGILTTPSNLSKYSKLDFTSTHIKPRKDCKYKSIEWKSHNQQVLKEQIIFCLGFQGYYDLYQLITNDNQVGIETVQLLRNHIHPSKSYKNQSLDGFKVTEGLVDMAIGGTHHILEVISKSSTI